MFDPVYVRQAELVLQCLSEIGRYPCFALKGGTAINLFLRSMPRLSVDIDLTYVRRNSRSTALDEIDEALRGVAQAVQGHLARSVVEPGEVRGQVVRLFVSRDGARIKIEPNLVLRGTVFPVVEKSLCREAQEQFERFVKLPCLAVPDLFGGKLCAALDRQHPRDLYDIALLLEEKLLTPDVRRAFVVYLASHPRPMNELLSPRMKDIREDFERGFAGMERVPVALERLQDVQSRLPDLLKHALDDSERRFLISMKEGEPDWDALDIPHLRELPALKWKRMNIRKMAPRKHEDALRRLKQALET